jgi:lipopolysaccharide biosynthesis protein
LFPGHYQPHLPAELGFYDLRLPEVREAQASLAQEHGISGFCYYHYWFHGRRLLERPFQEVLASGKPDFPFCLCWANENWTRAWDGRERQVLVQQSYSHEDDRLHIRSLLPAFRDERYIRIYGKPFFLVYRPEDLPNPSRTAEIWREEASRAGIGDLFLAKVDSFVSGCDPSSVGFDASVEFAPDWRNAVDLMYRDKTHRLLSKVGLITDVYQNHEIVRYQGLVERMLAKRLPEYPFFRCVTPGFDNTPRRARGAAIFLEATPDRYERWLKRTVRNTMERNENEQRIVFVNAWNEWGEGNHLEPDEKQGRAYLEATQRVMKGVELEMPGDNPVLDQPHEYDVRGLKKFYWRSAKWVRDAKEVLRHVNFRSG